MFEYKFDILTLVLLYATVGVVGIWLVTFIMIMFEKAAFAIWNKLLHVGERVAIRLHMTPPE